MAKDTSMMAGRLTDRITLQRPDGGKQASGQLNRDDDHWVDIATVWAEVKCYRTGTADALGIAQHEAEYRFNIRWRPDLPAELRILWTVGGRLRKFELTGPPADWQGHRVGLTLTGRELVQDG